MPKASQASTVALRYVVLRHEGIPEPHFDVMFETSPGSKLATWRSTEWPITDQSKLKPLPDHRSEYLTYEGSVSSRRGYVHRIKAGNHSVDTQGEKELIVILETGDKLRLPCA